MRQNTKPQENKIKPVARALREIAIQDQIDTIMDSFDFPAARKISDLGGNEEGHEEKVLRQSARKVLQGAVAGGGWATGGGFTALLQEWRSQPGKGAVKISLFYGPSSLLEPHTEFSEDEILKVTP